VQINIPISSGLLLPPLTGDLPSYHQEIASSFRSEGGRVYIDTSFLLWLIRVGRAARREFLSFWGRADVFARPFVPVWAVHEFYRHLQLGTVSKQLNQSAKDYAAHLTSLAEHADVISDDTLCESTAFSNRQDLIDSIRSSALRLSECVALLKTHNTLYDEAVSEIIVFVNAHSLGTDIYQLLKQDHDAYKGRLEGRLPPGYEDAGKPENSFGDLVFWTEVLQHGRQTDHVIILTRDEKVDWRHIPNKMVVYDQTTTATHNVAGGRLQQPHPLLEFEAALSGIQHLNVVTPATLTLVSLLHFVNAMPMLLMASNPRPLAMRTASPNLRAMGMSAPPPSGTVVPPLAGTHANPSATVDASNLNDIDFDVLKAGSPRPLLEPIRRMLTQVQAAHPPALSIPELQDLLSTLDSYALVELGHLVTATPGPLGLLPVPDLITMCRSISVDKESALVLGCIMAIYFADDFSLREEPKQRDVAALLNHFCDDSYEPCRQRATNFLEAVSASVLVSPASWSNNIDIDLNLVRATSGQTKVVQTAVINGQSLLDDSAVENKRFANCVAPDGGQLQDFLNLLASTFALPSRLLKIEQTNRNQMLSWGPEEGFSSLRLRGAALTTNMELGFAGSQTEEF